MCTNILTEEKPKITPWCPLVVKLNTSRVHSVEIEISAVKKKTLGTHMCTWVNLNTNID
ncbi:hypothetical protein WDU94_006389, partial [Cyamophila willieti]